MRQAPTSFLGMISKALHANFDNVAREPLPQRWIDLIRYLNERERDRRDDGPPDKPAPSGTPTSH